MFQLIKRHGRFPRFSFREEDLLSYRSIQVHTTLPTIAVYNKDNQAGFAQLAKRQTFSLSNWERAGSLFVLFFQNCPGKKDF